MPAAATTATTKIASLSTKADTEVSGFVEISVGYQGKYDMIVSVGNRPAQFIVDPGSRRVKTMGYDLTSVLHPGERIVIGEEVMEVLSVFVGEIEVKEYHIQRTDGVALSGYRMDSYIGSATISGTSLTEANGLRLESILRPGEVIEVFTNEIGDKQLLTVTSIVENSISFSPSFAGSTTRTPIYARKKLIVAANSSSASMQASVESLLHADGSVEVSREGPTTHGGFTWHITFPSNMGESSCSHQLSWCFTSSTESVNYIRVSGLGIHDGDYIQTSFLDGRPRYELLGRSRRIFYDSASSEWRLYSGTASVVSFVASSDTSVPFSGWSNEAVVAPSNGATPLLLGLSAVAEVSTVQAGIRQLFKDTTIVYSNEFPSGQHEVQVVEVLSDEDDLGGSFELYFGTIPQKITIYFDESSEDLTTKLQSLSGVGRVSVDSAEPFDKFGRIWLVTYLSNSGDVPLLRHYGTSSLQGTNVSLNISESVKGSFGEHNVVVNGLKEGGTYASRICAENEAGVGPCYPMALSVSSPPGPLSLQLGAVTKSQAEVKFTEPLSNGSRIISYKFEWTTSSTFGSPARANARVSCRDESEILGFLRFIYGTESSVPIDIRSSAAEITQAFNTFEFLNEVEITIVTNEDFELEWEIAFLYDVGPVGSMSLDTENVRCQSEEPLVDSAITMSAVGTMPTDYGSREVMSDGMSCGSVTLGEFSAAQYLTLVASSSAVTGGSYQLTLDGESSVCIPFSASESQMKDAIEGLENVEEVHVTAITAPIGSHFPYEYRIAFKGNYAYGDWPALQINQSFGAGDCDPFVGVADHRVTILPIRDESLCLDGADITVAIVAGSITSVGGTFDISYGHETLEGVSVGASASEMKAMLAHLIHPDVRVTRHDHDDTGEGVAWAVTYPRSSSNIDRIRIVDTFATGKNAQVTVHPILAIKIFSPENDSSGDFRIVIDGESTAPLSYRASQAKILLEMHSLSGIGKVNMLGPAEGDVLSSVQLRGLVDDSFTSNGHKAIALVGDFTSTFAPGDQLMVGTCDLKIKSISHEGYDETQGAGNLYDTLYSASPETAKAKALGYSILQISSMAVTLSFATDCSQVNGVNEVVHVGSILNTGHGVDHSMIVKSYTADLEAIEIVPERNWRGTAPRIFFKPPSGLLPLTFMMTGIVKEKRYIVRASARNCRGYGSPSPSLEILPSSTVPSAPTNVLLFSQ